MAHKVETMFSGEGKLPWHGIGTVIDGLATAAEALEYSGLDWEVKLEPVTFGPDNEPFPGRMAAVRQSDRKPLEVVSDDYHVFQNKAAFEFFDAVTDAGTGEAHYTAAGSLQGGQRVFLTAQIGDTFNVCGEDAHKMFLLLTNYHNGKGSLTAATTMIRAVCDNTVTMGLRSAKSKWTLRHKSSLEGKVQEARDALKMTFKYADAFEAEVEKLMGFQVTKDQFNKIAEDIIPESKFQHDKDVAGLMDVFENEKTVNDTNAKGTGWGAYNAITYWADWERRYQTDDSRFKSIMDAGFGEKLRDKALGRILAVA